MFTDEHTVNIIFIKFQHILKTFPHNQSFHILKLKNVALVCNLFME